MPRNARPASNEIVIVQNFRLTGDRVLSSAATILALGGILFLTGCAGIRVTDTSRSFDTVVIDPGHGGHDSGAVGRRGTREKSVALDVANRVESKLRGAGFRTVMTRDTDRFITLGKRTRTLNRQDNAVMVSIHFNSARRRSAKGIETFYHSRCSRRLATKIQDQMLRAVRAPNRGVKRANFYVLRKARYPAVLVECGFLSNYYEDRLARRSSHREKLAQRIAQGVVEQRYGGRGMPRRPESLIASAYGGDR